VNILDLSQGQGPPAFKQPFIVAMMTDGFLARHTDTAQRYVATMVEAIKYIRDPANQERVPEIAKKDVLPGVAPDIALEMVLEEIATTRNLRFEASDLNNVLAILNGAHLLKVSVGPADVIDFDLQPPP
jgi:ABC-type nitrate/sulfonate/bicarbonate transport system substrate-binding protein